MPSLSTSSSSVAGSASVVGGRSLAGGISWWRRWITRDVIYVITLLTVLVPCVAFKAVGQVAIAIPGGTHCMLFAITKSGFVADMVFRLLIITAVGISFLRGMWSVAVFVRTRRRNWEIRMGLAKSYEFRTYAMAIVGTIGAFIIAINQVRDIGLLVKKFRDPTYTTISRDELIKVGTEEFGSKLNSLYLNKVCVSLVNPFVFAFFGTTRQAGEIYLRGLKRVMKFLGASDKVLDKLSVQPRKHIGRSTIDTRFHSGSNGTSSALTHPNSTISITTSAVGRAPSSSFENATTAVRVSRDREKERREKQKKKDKDRKKSRERERDGVGRVSQYQISVGVLRLSTEHEITVDETNRPTEPTDVVLGS
ncbi:hypothetical protein HK102_006101 [Quaeritorhiza haematococci]|nr:hypothetical protein HK102_006101 [Quaeritorhiza haematococci]